MSTSSPTPEQREAFRKQALEMAQALIAGIEGPQPPFVVLEALCLVHKYTVSQLPPHLLGQAAMAMAAYAGELMQADAKGMGFPFPAPIH